MFMVVIMLVIASMSMVSVTMVMALAIGVIMRVGVFMSVNMCVALPTSMHMFMIVVMLVFMRMRSDGVSAMVMFLGFACPVVVMRRGVGASEQQADLTCIEQSGDLFARCKAGFYVGEGMGPHHRRHHLLVDRKRHINGVALDHRRPVLVAEPVAQLKAGAENVGWRQLLQPLQLNDQHILQRNARHDNDVLRLVNIQHIAIMQMRGSRQRNRQFNATF